MTCTVGKNAYGKPQHDWKTVDGDVMRGSAKSDPWNSKVVAKEAMADGRLADTDAGNSSTG